MKYNIMTVCNRSYFPFLTLFLNSLFRNANLDLINSIFIVDIDLGKYRAALPTSEKIKFINSSETDAFSGVHSEGWYKATKQKTEHLEWVLNQVPRNETVLLVDSDVLVLRDFSDVIDSRYSMQFTSMAAGGHLSKSGIYINQIACFLACNQTEASLMFLRDWNSGIRSLQQRGAGRPHETPAMNRVIREYQLQKPFFRAGFLDENVVCADMVISPQTLTVHLKSPNQSADTPPRNFLNRFRNLRRTDGRNLEFDLDSYIDSGVFAEWCSEYEPIGEVSRKFLH